MKPARGTSGNWADAAVITARARGAIAVVGVWGPGALGAVSRRFRGRSTRALEELASGVPRVGRFGPDPGEEVVVVVIDDDPPSVEIHGHGGPLAVGLVLDTLAREHARIRRPQAWVRRDAADAIALEARLELERARTARVAGILLAEAESRFLRGEVEAILARLGADPAETSARLAALLQRAGVGTRLTRGWKVALAGRPNVGKSSLMNALAGHERAIVSPIPGTTRDALRVATAVEGWPVAIVDTAGIRQPADPLERAGIDRALASQSEADLVVVVLDRSMPLAPEDHAILAAWPGALRVANKADLPDAWREGDRPRVDLAVSATRGEGIDALAAAIARGLVPEPPPPLAALPFRPRHARHLERALEALRSGDLSRTRRELSGLIRPLVRTP